MNSITRRISRKRTQAPGLGALLRQYPELRPKRASKNQFQPRIDPAPGRERKPARTGAERQFARMLDSVSMKWSYEPFCLAIGLKPTGTVRSFQPDFWLPELGLIVELCATASAKNQKIELARRGWPRLAVLVITDAQVEQIAQMNPTRWQIADAFARLLDEQVERIAAEGHHPYRRRRSRRPAAAPQAAAVPQRASDPAASTAPSSRRRGRRGGKGRSRTQATTTNVS